jgi:ABC-type branched-subunit amino acid transport system substrate-binding protein
MSEVPGGPEPVPQPPLRLDETSTLIGRIAMVATFAAVFALVAIFAKPIWQGAQAMLDSVFQTSESAKSNRLATNPVTADRPVATTGAATATKVAAGGEMAASVPPSANVQPPAGAQPPVNVQPPANVQASVSPPTQQTAAPPPAQEPRRVFARGVSDTEIKFGISAAFSGAAKELGQNMKIGIETAFNAVNATGGVFGRRLRLIAADDGYEPKRTAETMKQLYEKDQVFGVIGNVGTPTATVGLPFALERKMLFFGAFTGAGLLRSDPPDRYVFNYRASYAEETDAVVQYLVKVKRLKTNQIAVFAQQDAYGDSGFAGVAKAVRALGGDDSAILRLNYTRNTVDVDAAVDDLKKHRIPIRAVIMVPAYRAAAKFIEKTRDLYPNMIYTSVSFVGSTALANELMLLGPRFATGIIVTQVVPAIEGHSSLVLDYKAAFCGS